jgi:hypothetical protein
MKMKKERLLSWSSYELEGSLDSVIEKLQQVKKDFNEKGYSDYTIDLEDEWGYYDEHTINFVVYGARTISAKEIIDSKKQCFRVA